MYVMVLNFIGDFRNYLIKPSDEIFLCLNKNGDGSVICHFSEEISLHERLNVTKIKSTQNSTIGEIRMTSIVGIHRLNMPEHFPGKI